MANIPGVERATSAEDIRIALRLGWAVAEVRGRTRLEGDPILIQHAVPVRREGALPLSPERSPDEQHIEAMKVLIAVSDGCGVAGLALPTYEDGPVIAPTPGETAPEYIRRLSSELMRGAEAAVDRAATWARVTEVFRLWDQHIQDTLASGPFGRASAYQLGRGLAEMFWALDPESPPEGITGWGFLVGGGRYQALCLLVDRISFALKPFTADAVKGSLALWMDYVERSHNRPPHEARALLFKQVIVWRDLLASDTDPLNLLPPRMGVAGARRILPVVHGFVWELGLFLVGALTLVLAVVLAGHGEKFGPIGAVAGIIGMAGAAGIAAVTALTQELGSKLRRATNRDLAITATTTLHMRNRFGRFRAELPVTPRAH